MNGITWSAQDIETLRNMVEIGASFNDIATKLGKTRNAVAGMVWRLKIKRPKKKPPIKVKKIKEEPKVEVISTQPIIEKEPLRYTITELTANQCRWAIGETEEGFHTFCANQTTQGPYCPFHNKLAYVRPRSWGEE